MLSFGSLWSFIFMRHGMFNRKNLNMGQKKLDQPSYQSNAEETKKHAQQQLDQWIQEHKGDYISRGIYQNTLETLERGVICSSEANFRKTMKHNWGGGEVKDISQVVADLKSESATYIAKEIEETRLLGNKHILKIVVEYAATPTPALPPRVQVQNNSSSLKYAQAAGFISEDQSMYFWGRLTKDKLSTIKLRDDKYHQIIFDPQCADQFSTAFRIEGIPQITIRSWCDDGYKERQNELLDKYRKFDLYEHGINVACDMVSADPIDKRLAQVWDISKPFSSNLEKLAKKLNEARESEIYGGYTDCYLGACYNRIGDFNEKCKTIVLRGKPDNIISQLASENFMTLLRPFENKGELFNLDLTQEDTIVIGARSELAPYVTKMTKMLRDEINNISLPSMISPIINLIAEYAQAIRIFYIEDMSAAQITFFKIPPNMQPVKESQDLVKNTPAI